ncbi:DUF1398 domain-containing protein [Pirellulaceae bacterium SH467]
MDCQLNEILQECAVGSLNGVLTFPEIVGKLAAMGVERYHADYVRRETTYYLSDSESYVVSTPHPWYPIAKTFSGADVESAVRQSQRNEHTYLEFLRKTSEAGCVGYFVQITGRRVVYFGREGDCHVETFPTAPIDATL